MLRDTTEELEIANLFRNPSRRSQPMQNITSSTFGKESTPVDSTMTPDDISGMDVPDLRDYERYDPYGGYDPYDPYGPEGPYFGSPYGKLPTDSPHGGYDPYAVEDARLAALAAGMPGGSESTSGRGDYYSSPEWLRRLSTVGGPAGPYPGAIPDYW